MLQHDWLCYSLYIRQLATSKLPFTIASWGCFGGREQRNRPQNSPIMQCNVAIPRPPAQVANIYRVAANNARPSFSHKNNTFVFTIRLLALNFYEEIEISSS